MPALKRTTVSDKLRRQADLIERLRGNTESLAKTLTPILDHSEPATCRVCDDAPPSPDAPLLQEIDRNSDSICQIADLIHYIESRIAL